MEFENRLFGSRIHSLSHDDMVMPSKVVQMRGEHNERGG